VIGSRDNGFPGHAVALDGPDYKICGISFPPMYELRNVTHATQARQVGLHSGPVFLPFVDQSS